MSFNWQQKGWPNVTVNRSALRYELKAFEEAFKSLQRTLKKPQDLEFIAQTLTDEALKTSAIEGVRVDESVVMSSICKALGIKNVPLGFTKDVRAEGVAQMMLTVREKWNAPLSANLLMDFHRVLMVGEKNRFVVGAFRSHKEPMRVVFQHADGTFEIRYEAPPSDQVPKEIAKFVQMWKTPKFKPADIALKATMLHLHFESIHPFEDGNGRIGRALVSKVIAEGIGLPLILPISTIIDRHRVAYYNEINEASCTLDWTNWAAFFITLLTEMINSFIQAIFFVQAKRDYLLRYEHGFSERAKKVIHRIFEDGDKGVKSGLSVAKWMRIAKVSKPTAIEDLKQLEKLGAIIRFNIGLRLGYQFSDFTNEPLNEPLKNGDESDILYETQFNGDKLSGLILKLITTHPGTQLSYLKSVVALSAATVKRSIAILVKAGKIEHRGSKKTGGYYLRDNEDDSK